MKLVYPILLIVLFCTPQTDAQSIAYSQTAFTSAGLMNHEQPLSYRRYRREHCRAVKVGEVLLITGGGLGVAGAATILTAPNTDAGILQAIGGFLIASAGAYCVVGGGITLLCGEIHDHRHRYSFSIEGNKQGLGIACHF